MNLEVEWLLHTWGGIYNEDSPTPIELRKYEGFTYFNNKKFMDAVIKKLSKYEKYGLVVVTEESSSFTHKRSIACMDMIYDGKTYYYEYDFGYEFPEENARFMFFRGNYSCDCNKRLFLSREYDEVTDSDICGNTIKLENFRIEYR